MNRKYSYKENQDSLQGSISRLGELLTKKLTIEEISELIPGALHINSLSDFSIRYFDKSGESIYKCPTEKVISEGIPLMKEIIHPEEFISVPKRLQEFVDKNDSHSILSFFQRLKGVSEKHYEWYFTSCKISGYGLISITQSVRNLGGNRLQIERILDENVFFKKNFKKFQLLTKREKEILKELAIGKTAPKISQEYFISVNTVKTHRQRVFEKLEVKTFTELYKYAFHFDLL